MHDPGIARIAQGTIHAEPQVFAAPGRVNLIGEHTDYAEGFVMPAAIDFATLAGISPRTDGKIVLYAENYSEERVFDAAALPAKARGALDRLSAGGAGDSCAAKGTRFPRSA